jgi:REP element-mobilizing transposase RayT
MALMFRTNKELEIGHTVVLTQKPDGCGVGRLPREKFSRLLKFDPNMWQIGYFCCTTGRVIESVTRQYIAEQGKKRKKTSGIRPSI